MIGIMGAMHVEIDELLKYVDVIHKDENNGFMLVHGMLSGKEVMIGLSGVGGVNASMTMTQMLERYELEAVINIGTAGGLKTEENVLDVIISDQVLKHDMDTDTVFGIPLGFHDNNRLIYQTDKDLQNKAKEIMTKMSDSRVFVGNIVSGDKFICKDDDVRYITKYFPSAYCADMEAACIAQVCNFYHVPFVVVRSLSDIVLHEGNEMQFEEYVQKASARSALFVKELVAELQNQ